MKSLLILVILCCINLSKAGVLRRNLGSLADDYENKNKKPFMLSKLSKYPDDFGLNTEEYRQNSAISEDARIYEQQKRYPHRNRYYKSLDSPFQRRFLPVRDASNVQFSKTRRGKDLLDRRLDSYNAEAKELSFNDRDFTVKSHILRRDKNNNQAHIPKKDAHIAKATSNGESSDEINVAGTNSQNNQNRYPDKAFPVEENKRDLTKKMHSNKLSEKKLQRSAQLYILGMLLILLPVASIIVAIFVPLGTFCCSKCKKPDEEDTDQNDPKNITVKTAIVNKSPAKVKHDKKSESYQNIVKNFVSNDIDGEGDAVAKDMKLERWMIQGIPLRPLPRSNKYTADMESVAEEHSDLESTFEDPMQSPILPDGSEDSDEELMPLSGRNKKKGRGGTIKANRREFKPFRFPEVGATIGRVLNPRHPRYTDLRHTNPRNLFSLIQQPGRFGKPTTQSMVEMIP